MDTLKERNTLEAMYAEGSVPGLCGATSPPEDDPARVVPDIVVS